MIELMMALLIMTFGLLSSGQLFCYAVGLESLSRSKGVASAAVQDRLETLSELYQRDPLADAVRHGEHGPENFIVANPLNGKVLNCFDVRWTVSPVADSRPGKQVDAVHVSVTALPVTTDGRDNRRPLLNKKVSVSTIFSPRWR